MASSGNRPTRQPAAPSPARPRWHSAPWWVGVSGVFTIVGVIVAIVTLLATRPGGEVTERRPDTGSAPAPAAQQTTPGTARASRPASTDPTTAEPATAAYGSPVTKQLRLAAPDVGGSSWLDVDEPRVFNAPSYTDEVNEKTADLEYTNDGEFSTLFTHEFARVGYVPAGIATPEQCVAQVDLQPLGQHESPQKGRNICIVTESGTVALIRVVQRTEPHVVDTWSLLVTAKIWKPTGS